MKERRKGSRQQSWNWWCRSCLLKFCISWTCTVTWKSHSKIKISFMLVAVNLPVCCLNFCLYMHTYIVSHMLPFLGFLCLYLLLYKHQHQQWLVHFLNCNMSFIGFSLHVSPFLNILAIFCCSWPGCQMIYTWTAFFCVRRSSLDPLIWCNIISLTD